jgi:hypothetical protein
VRFERQFLVDDVGRRVEVAASGRAAQVHD